MSRRITRRDFIRTSAAAAGAVLFMPNLANAKGANEKLNIACIGVGGRGGSHLGPAAGENLMAICDIDTSRLGGVARKFPKAKAYTDYRKLFAEQKTLDAVIVATPDHSHYPASMMAIQRGLGVYCEKPLTWSIAEARRLTQAAKDKKVATQMGNQGHSSEGNRLLCEWIWAGGIGDVTEVHCWTDRAKGWWPQGVARPKDTPPVPGHIKWDEWLGPAPERPYHPAYLPFKWRGWVDFGCGALGDMGCHIMDGPVWSLKLGEAKRFSIEAEHSGFNGETYPGWSIVRYEFPARGEMPPVKLTWYDGGKRPPKPDELKQIGGNGSYFVGSKAKMISETYGGARIIPDEKMRAFKRPEKSIPRSRGHHRDWFEACKAGRSHAGDGKGDSKVPPASSNFVDSAGPLAEIVLAGNLAIRAGEKVEWDVAKMRSSNSEKANGFVDRAARKGWDFPGPGKST